MDVQCVDRDLRVHGGVTDAMYWRKRVSLVSSRSRYDCRHLLGPDRLISDVV